MSSDTDTRRRGDRRSTIDPRHSHGWVMAPGSSIRASASEVAVVDILSDLEGYSGRRIEVGGQITNLRTGTFRSKQPQYTFDLSDGMRSILVFGSGSPPCPNG